MAYNRVKAPTKRQRAFFFFGKGAGSTEEEGETFIFYLAIDYSSRGTGFCVCARSVCPPLFIGSHFRNVSIGEIPADAVCQWRELSDGWMSERHGTG